MAFFPIGPGDGQQANVGNITYQWNSTQGVWNRVGTTITTVLDGPIVNFSGNLNVTGTGISAFQGSISATGNIVAGNVTTNALSVATSFSTTGNLSAGNIATPGVVSAAGNVTSGGAVSATGALTGSSLSVSGAAGSASLATGNITAGNVVATGSFRSAFISSTGNVTIDGNVLGGGSLVTAGAITANGFISLANVSATGNVAGTYFIGNGSLLTGISTGGVSLGSRSNVSISTGSIANAATANISVTGYAGYALYKITTSAASWVRVYSSADARTADAGRSQFNDPQPGAGVIAEAITLGANVVLITPGAIGFVDSDPVSNSIPLAVTNLSGGSADITVSLTLLQIEV